MKINKLLLCFFVIFENVANVKAIKRNHEKEKASSHILNELLTGPLKGRTVTLIVKDTAKGTSAEQDELIRNADEPISLLRLPPEMPVGLFGIADVKGEQPQNTVRLIREFPLRRRNVVVMILDVDDPFWWPLFFPPDEWLVSTIVFISSSPSYFQEMYLKSPLMQRPSSAVLLCPGGSSNDSSTSPLEVWSWISFGGRTNAFYKGIWNPASFQSWDQLFVDDFREAIKRDTPVAPLSAPPTSRIGSSNSYAPVGDGRGPSRCDSNATDVMGEVQRRKLPMTRNSLHDNITPLNLSDVCSTERTYGKRFSLITNNQGTTKCLTFVLAQWDPFVVILNRKPPYIFYGSTIDMVNIIAEHLGICYRLIRPTDNDWGTMFPNGTWTGSVGILNRREAIMSVFPYGVSLHRTKGVDFSVPVYMDEFTIGYHKYRLQTDMAGFVKPFTFQAWMCIFGSLLIITPAMIFLRLYQHDDSGNPNARKITFSPTAWPLCCLIDQASIWEPQHDPSRMAGCLWELMGFILSCVYRSTLMAMLIAPKVQLPFNSVEELAKTNIPIWAPIGGLVQDSVESAVRGDRLVGIKKNMVYTNDTMSGVADYKAGRWGYAVARRTLVYYQHEEFTKYAKCNQYVMVDSVNKPTPISVAFPKGSIFKPIVDNFIIKLTESGILELLYKRHVINATFCKSPLGSGIADEARPLALYNFYGVFSVFMGGMILGSVSFLLEILTRANFTRGQ